MGKTWIKLYVSDANGALGLPKEMCRAWIALQCLAGQLDNGDRSGRLQWSPDVPLTQAEIVAALRVEEDEWILARRTFERRGMVHTDGDGTVVLTHYHRLQVKKDASGRSLRPGYLYVMRSGDLFKIGRSVDVRKRLHQLSTSAGAPIDLVWARQVRDAHRAERDLHERFSGKRVHKEWFALENADIDLIASLYE